MTFTEVDSQTRYLSFRSTSVHIVSSASSLVEFNKVRMRSASSTASSPREIVPLIGHVSMRRSATRTNISGEAATRNSPSPRLINAPYGAGFARCSSLNAALGKPFQGSAKT